MSKMEGPRAGRHPGKMPGGVKLADCVRELMGIFGQMIVSKADRASPPFLGMSRVAAGMDFYHPDAREPYVTNWYLQDAAKGAMIKALSSGHLPTWTDYDGNFVELDAETLFGVDKWNPSYTVQTGSYVALNVAHGRDGPTRAECDGATLWVREEDWPRIRGELIADRERSFGSVLPGDMLRLMLGEPATTDSVPIPLGDAYEPMGASWTLYEAVAWIGTQDLEFVEHQRPANFSGTITKNYGAVVWKRMEQSLADRKAAGKAEFTANVACDRLLAGCATGSVKTTGIPGEPGEKASRRNVPPYDYVGAVLWQGRGGSLHRIVNGKIEEARWHDLRFLIDDVKALTTEAASQSNAAASRTGATSKRPPVSGSDLRAWVRDRNIEGWDQDEIFKGAAGAFPQHDVPGRPTIRKLDADVRLELDLRERTRGRNKKGS